MFYWDKDGQKTKGIYISETFQKYREISLKNITSPLWNVRNFN